MRYIQFTDRNGDTHVQRYSENEMTEVFSAEQLELLNGGYQVFTGNKGSHCVDLQAYFKRCEG